ncbi:CDKN2AIP N-terminal-like protein isoform 1-T1 [Liasis olivaceus]
MVRGDNVVGTEPEFPEQFRSYSENEKHWQARRAFIMRNAPLGGGEALPPLCLDQLLSLSMVWANHLFLGCRYRLLVLRLHGLLRMPWAAAPGCVAPGWEGWELSSNALGDGRGVARSRRPAVFSFNACAGIARYSKDLLEKVTEMANGIEVEDVPHFTTRDELTKKNQY